jgi:hypothetical protein
MIEEESLMVQKTLLILIMLVLLIGGATSGIGVPAMLFMALLTAIAFMVDLSPDAQQE